MQPALYIYIWQRYWDNFSDPIPLLSVSKLSQLHCCSYILLACVSFVVGHGSSQLHIICIIQQRLYFLPLHGFLPFILISYFAFNMLCEIQILPAHLLHYVSNKFQLCICDSENNFYFYSRVYQPALVISTRS